MRLCELLVVIALAAAALAGAIAAVAGRGADDAFLLRQKNPTRVTTAAVEKLMLNTAPDPDAPHDSSATRARCRTEGRRELRNPWQCTVRFPSGRVADFVVTIRTDGSYRARYRGDTATATGCCLSVPAAE